MLHLEYFKLASVFLPQDQLAHCSQLQLLLIEKIISPAFLTRWRRRRELLLASSLASIALLQLFVDLALVPSKVHRANILAARLFVPMRCAFARILLI